MQLVLLSLALLGLTSVVVEPRVHSHRKRSHHHLNLVPHPQDIDPSKMSAKELAKLLNKLADYVRSASGLKGTSTNEQFSEEYESERRRFRNEKKVRDVLSIASNLAMNKPL